MHNRGRKKISKKIKIIIIIIHGVKLYYKLVFPDTLFSFLISNNTSNMERIGGVYEVPCNTCNKVYFGETLKSLPFRISQHQADVRRLNVSNSLFNHITEHHSIAWNRASFIFLSKSKNINRLVESFFIKYKDNFNLSPGFFEFDNFTFAFLKNLFKQR